MKAPIKLTLEEFEELQDKFGGYCLACGEANTRCGVEAHREECNLCGKKKVYGLLRLRVMNWIQIAAHTAPECGVCEGTGIRTDSVGIRGPGWRKCGFCKGTGIQGESK